MKRRSLAVFLSLGLLLFGTASVIWYQRSHPEPSMAATAWDRYPMEADNILVSTNYGFDIIDDDSSVVAFVDNLTGDVIFQRSDDGGQTWDRTIVAAAAGATNDFTKGVSIDAEDTDTIFIAFVGTDSASINSAATTDGGASWNLETVASGGADEFGEAHISVYDTNTVAVGYLNLNGVDAILAISTDGGDNYNSNTFQSAPNVDIDGIQIVGANDVLIDYLIDNAGDFEVHVARTTDGGATLDTDEVVGLAVDSQPDPTIFGGFSAVDTNTMAVCYFEQGTGVPTYAYSTDGGNSFTPVTIAGDGSAKYQCSVNMVSATEAVVHSIDDIGHNVVSFLTDSGNTINYSEPLADVGGYSEGMIVLALDMDQVFVSGAEFGGAVLSETYDGATTPWIPWNVAGQSPSYTATVWPSYDYFFHAYNDDIGKDLHILRYYDPTVTWDEVFVDGDDTSLINGGTIETGAWVTGVAPDEDHVFFIYNSDENFPPEQEAKVAYTSDAGDTWNTSIITGPQFQTDSLSIDSIDGTTVDVVLYDSNSGELQYYRSDDGAATWNYISSVETGGDTYVQTNIQRVDPDLIYVSYYVQNTGDVWFAYSGDNGLSWDYMNIAGSSADPESELEMDYDPNTDAPYVAFFDADAGVLHSYRLPSGAPSWEAVTIDSQHAGGRLDIYADSGTVAVSWVNPATNQLHYAISTDDAAAYFYRVIPDYANTLPYQFNPQVQLQGPDLFRTAFQSSKNFNNWNDDFDAVIMSNSITANLDDWAYSEVDTSGADVGTGSDLVAADASTLFTSYYDSTNDLFYVANSTNGGSTWNPVEVDANGYQSAVDAPTPDDVYAAYLFHDAGPEEEVWLAFSHDGGNTFDFAEIDDAHSNEINGPLSVDAYDTDNIFVAYTNVVDGDLWSAYSNDGGNTFTNVMVDSNAYISSTSAIESLDASTLFLVYGNTSGQLKLARSTNGGASWSTDFIDSNANSYDAYSAITVVDQDYLYVVYGNSTDAYFASSADGGDNWDIERTFNNTSYVIADDLSIDATDANHIYISAYSPSTSRLYMFSSPDAGDTWDAFDIDMEGSGEYSVISVADDDHIFVSGHSSAVQSFRVFRTATQGLSDPVLIRPQDGSVVTNDTVALSARYADGSSTGVTNYRVSTSSTTDCVSNINIFDETTSDTTENTDQPTYGFIGGLQHGETYYWCAQNDNGSIQSSWIEMGEFTTNFSLPVGVSYSSYLGGSSFDAASDVVMASGDIYVSGGTYSTNFPTTFGVYNDTLAGDRDVFVAQLSPDGNGEFDLQYSTFVGGSQDDVFGWQVEPLATELRVVAAEAYVAVSTFSTDFPTTAGAFDTTKGGGTGNSDVAFFQLSGGGSALLYSTYLGGTGTDGDYQDGLDVSGGLVYIGGTTLSDSFPSTAGSYNEIAPNSGNTHAFVVVLDPAGNGAADLQYGTFFGGSDATDAMDIDFDDGLVYLVGYSSASDLPTFADGGTPFQDTPAGGGQESYLAIFDPSGNGSDDLVYATFLGGSDPEDLVTSIMAQDGLAYMVGEAASSDFPVTSGSYSEFSQGGIDAFFSILEPAGNGSDDLLYSTYFGGSDDDHAYDLTLLAGTVAVAGQSNSSDLPTTSLESPRDVAGYIAIFDPQGNGDSDLLSADLLDGGSFDGVSGLGYDGVQYLYVAGQTNSDDFPAFAYGGAPYDQTTNGDADAFVALYDTQPAVDPATIPPEPPVLVYPDDGSSRAGITVLAAQYEHVVLPGTIDFRVSDADASECLAGTSIEYSDTSDLTDTRNETAFLEVPELAFGTKFWCARSDNGTTQSAWTTMGTYEQDSGVPYFNYSTYLGGSTGDNIGSISVHDGVVYVVGSTDSSDLPGTSGAYDDTLTGGSALYIAGLEPGGNGTSDLLFATYFEASGGVGASDIFADASGVYIVGQTNSTSLPTAGGTGGTPYDPDHNHGASTADSYIARFSTDGSDLEYSTYFGGTTFDAAQRVQVDGGLVYVVGQATTSFPTTAGAYDTTYGGGTDVYIAVFDLAGNGASDLLYSSYLGQAGFELPLSLDVDSGIVYFGGYADASYPTTAGAFDTVKAGFGTESILTVFNPAGGGSSDLLYSTYFGGTDQETLPAIRYDASDDTIVGCMDVRSTDIPTTAGAYSTTGDGFGDSYIFRLNPAGTGASDLVYGSYFEDGGGCSDVRLFNGDIYMAMQPDDTDFVTTADAYGFAETGLALVRFNLGGNGSDDLIYSSYFPAASDSMDMEGNQMYLGGTTQDASFPTFADPGDPYDQGLDGFEDGAIMRVDFSETPYNPTLLYPDDGAARAGKVTLSAQYRHPSLPGTVEYRVSGGSASDCVNNINIVDSGSDTTSTEDESTTYALSSILANGTYNWCARADDGNVQTDWIPQGEWEQDSGVPYLNYQTYLGGNGDDRFDDLFVDSGVVYFTGTISSTDFPGTAGVYDTTHNGGQDAIVGAMVLDGNGSSDLDFATYLGSAANENGTSVKFVGGKVYGTAAVAAGTTIPTTSGAYDTSFNGFTDIYAYRLAADGSALEYATFIGASQIDTAYLTGVVGGVMYMAGTAQSTGFPTTAGAFDTSFNGFSGVPDGVFVVLNPAGGGSSDLLYGSYYGSTGQDFLYSKRLVGTKFYFAMQAGNTVTTTAGAYDTSTNGGQDAVVGVFNPAGTGSADLEYASYYGGSSNEFMLRMDTDTADNTIVITGYTASSDLPTTSGAYQGSGPGSNTDGYIVKIDPAGNGASDLQYATYLGGSGTFDFLNQIFVSDGIIYVAGSSNSTDFPVEAARSYSIDNAEGVARPVLVVLDPAGNGSNDLTYATFLNVHGTSYSDGNLTTIAVEDEIVYLAGQTVADGIETIADPGTPYDTTSNSSTDGFLTRIDFSNVLPPAPSAPTLIYPDEASVRAGLLHLSVMYSHATLTGFTDYRISTGSLADCVNNVNIVDSGSSTTTSSTTQPTDFTSDELVDDTYNWCARNNNGLSQSAWTGMGSVIKDHTVPYMNYATYLGGTAADFIQGMEVSGTTAYFAGMSASADLPITSGVYDNSLEGFSDMMVGALTMAGAGSTDLQFLTYVGGDQAEAGSDRPAMAYDGSSIYVTGTTESTNFPTTSGAYDTAIGGTQDWFVFKISDDGTTLEYSTYLGGTGFDEKPTSIKVDTGLIYIGGSVRTGFPTTGSSYDTTHNGGTTDLALAVINPAGAGSADLQYSTFLGGTCSETGMYIEVVGGIIYYVGDSCSTGFPTTIGAYDTSNSPVSTDFVVGRFNPALSGTSALLYSSFIGASGAGISDEGQNSERMTVDPATGIIYATGLSPNSGGTDFPTTAGAYQTAISGSSDRVFFVFDTTIAGSGALLYSTFLGDEVINDLAFDDGLLYLAGGFTGSGTTVLTTGTAYGNTANGGVLIIMDPSGNGLNDLVYGTLYGAPFNSTSFISVARSGTAVYLGGSVAEDSLGFYGGRIDTFAAGDVPYDSSFNAGAGDGLLVRFDMAGGPDVTPPPASGGGGGSQIQQQQPTSVGIPVVGPVNVLGTSSVLFNFTYSGSNQTGFRLLNEQNQAIVQVANSIATTITETGLQNNSLVTGRKVAAYNASTQGLSSAAYPDVYTHIIPVTPALVSRVDDRIRVRVNETPNNLIVGQSGIQFELMLDSDISASAIVTSPWVQTLDYVFEGTLPGQAYYVRSRSRNADGVVTPWSNNVLVEGEELVEDVELLVSLSVVASNGATVEADKLLNPNDLLYGELTIINNGSTMADNVFLALPLPPYLAYVPGSLSVDGVRQSDSADLDAGQADNDVIAAIWPTLDFAFGHKVRFTLAFDTPRLVEDFIKPVETDLQEIRRELGDQITTDGEFGTQPVTEIHDVPKEPLTAPEVKRGDFIDPNLDNPKFNESTESLRDVLAQAIAAEGPQLTMQASATHAGDPQPSYSNPVTAQPDLVVLANAPVSAPAPAPAPAPSPAPVPTPQETQTIEGILQGEFGTPQPGTPTLQTGQTTSSYDNGSFSIDVDGLELTGTAIANEDQIEFTGTTSQPFTVITLIFNDSVTAIAVSDINGEWRTFVDAETLGIQPGQEAQVRIEAIAAKGELRSERVSVGEVTVTRGVDGEVVAEFETIVSDNAFVTAINEISRQTIEVIQEQEPAIQTTLTAAAPVIVVSSVPLWGYLPYVPTLLYHFIIWLFGLFGRKKKEGDKKTYGVIYDAITKLPLPLAIVRIYEQTANKLVTTVVTDKLGRYDVLLAAGTYRLEVSKPQYQFPSQIVTATIDGSYDRVYQPNSGMNVQENMLVIPQVPIDPVNVQRDWELSFGVRKVWLAVQRVGHYLATPLLLVGSLSSILLVIASPDRAFNWVIVLLYVGLLASHLKLKPKAMKAWGVVYDIATNAALPLTTIQLIEPAYNKVVTSRLTDYQGRFSFLPEPGQYVVKANKPGYEQVREVVESKYKDRQPMAEQVRVDKPDQRIAGDVAMRQSS